MIEFDWSPLGEGRWQELGKDCGATERQLKFAAARFRGCSNAESARQAGYGSGASDANVRSTGYRLSRSNIIVKLLALAAADSSGFDGGVTRQEARQILSRLARGSDPSVRIRAIEQLSKMDLDDTAKAAIDDGFNEWRLVRDYLQMPGGGPAILWLWTNGLRSNQTTNMPLLFDVRDAVMRDDPNLWGRAIGTAGTNPYLHQRLNEPDWQLRERIKIWKEVNVTITPPPGVEVNAQESGSVSAAALMEKITGTNTNEGND
jgi:hypothetical protein